MKIPFSKNQWKKEEKEEQEDEEEEKEQQEEERLCTRVTMEESYSNFFLLRSYNLRLEHRNVYLYARGYFASRGEKNPT